MHPFDFRSATHPDAVADLPPGAPGQEPPVWTASDYLDHPATSIPRAPGVAEAMAAALEFGNPGRSSHAAAAGGAELIERVRADAAAFFGVPHPSGVIFTGSATLALNLAIQGLLRPGDHVVTTCLEHNSVLRPLWLMQSRGCQVSVVQRARPDGEFLEQLARELRPGTTRLVAVTHASNVTGTVLPVDEVVRTAHAEGVPVLLDAAQSAGHLPLSLRQTPADLVACGAHKGLMGPPGVGMLLVGNHELTLRPLAPGGTGLRSEALDPPAEFPHSYEAGTPNTPAIAGLGAALRFAATARFHEARRLAAELHARCRAELARIPGVAVYDAGGLPTLPTLAFTIAGWTPAVVAEELDRRHGIQVRAGLHCAPLLHRALGQPRGTVRAGFGPGNSPGTVERLCAAVARMAAAG